MSEEKMMIEYSSGHDSGLYEDGSYGMEDIFGLSFPSTRLFGPGAPDLHMDFDESASGPFIPRIPTPPPPEPEPIIMTVPPAPRQRLFKAKIQFLRSSTGFTRPPKDVPSSVETTAVRTEPLFPISDSATDGLPDLRPSSSSSASVPMPLSNVTSHETHGRTHYEFLLDACGIPEDRRANGGGSTLLAIMRACESRQWMQTKLAEADVLFMQHGREVREKLRAVKLLQEDLAVSSDDDDMGDVPTDESAAEIGRAAGPIAEKDVFNAGAVPSVMQPLVDPTCHVKRPMIALPDSPRDRRPELIVSKSAGKRDRSTFTDCGESDRPSTSGIAGSLSQKTAASLQNPTELVRPSKAPTDVSSHPSRSSINSSALPSPSSSRSFISPNASVITKQTKPSQSSVVKSSVLKPDDGGKKVPSVSSNSDTWNLPSPSSSRSFVAPIAPPLAQISTKRTRLSVLTASLVGKKPHREGDGKKASTVVSLDTTTRSAKRQKVSDVAASDEKVSDEAAPDEEGRSSSWACGECEYRTSNPRKKRRHQDRHTATGRKYQCRGCSYSSDSKETIRTHAEAYHTAEKTPAHGIPAKRVGISKTSSGKSITVHSATSTKVGTTTKKLIRKGDPRYEAVRKLMALRFGLDPDAVPAKGPFKWTSEYSAPKDRLKDSHRKKKVTPLSITPDQALEDLLYVFGPARSIATVQ
ncbi:hypothetical protein BV898_16888 [Hypsibius exemplaris]|uniref:C2H2-type domain-containing protein n=1 Tax=Hypsibius exemplaris TaxID=2072580 RepID=A0A9X6RM96_HYPEX|nr:hypothetical protein BV898_16888 [Hypsibius exemplaris]